MLHLVGCLNYLYQWCTVKQISDNEIYLLIKYIKSVLWRVAKCLSYIENARCLKVNLILKELRDFPQILVQSSNKFTVVKMRQSKNFPESSKKTTVQTRPDLVMAHLNLSPKACPYTYFDANLIFWNTKFIHYTKSITYYIYQ